MKLTETQRVGLMVILGGFTDEEDYNNLLFQTGEEIASEYLNLTEKQREGLLELAKEGLTVLNKLAEENL